MRTEIRDAAYKSVKNHKRLYTRISTTEDKGYY